MNDLNIYRVDLEERSYDIHIESGCLPSIGKAVTELFGAPSRCLIVTNEVVGPLYLETVRKSLKASGWHVETSVLPDGEKYKNTSTWMRVMDALVASKLSRNEPVIALGGGVVGDMTGFAASCYRRGIPFIQVPTTLLAQVDSSVGGKTAINHPHGKNMIGAFYQPRLVWIDPDVLKTLEIRELRAGVAELIKYGLIRDNQFFSYLEENVNGLLSLDSEVVSQVVHTSCRHKAEVVMADETEQGLRALLNLGHTFGHAIESMTHYSQYLHGEAVALGTLMAARLSYKLGHSSENHEMRIEALYKTTGLPTAIPQFPADQWLDAMGHDKKNVGSRIRYILLKEIGDAFIAENVSDDDIRSLIDSFQ
ncbi:MAG: 3-dehydroquinate synthase [Mariprofundaceae bacterium]